MLDDLSDQAPPASSLDCSDTTKPWPTPPIPPNRMAYQEWLLISAASIFQCECLPDPPILTLEALPVKGLVVYGARCGTHEFYASWDESSGPFAGWTGKMLANTITGPGTGRS
jgi:hypothetical protein